MEYFIIYINQENIFLVLTILMNRFILLMKTELKKLG
jgi:hypothetical protein